MLSRDDLGEKGIDLHSILNAKETILKKKNSELESRLFKKTRYYVIAVGSRSSTNDEETAKVRAYVYYNGYICFYSNSGKAYNKRDYISYIDFVKQAVSTKKYQWTDFWINKGQVITKDKGNNIHVDTELIRPFNTKTGIVGKVSEISLKLFYEFLKKLNKDDDSKLESLENSYLKGILQDKVERIVKNIPSKELIDKDGEIIIRTKIEGYNYITSYVKKILNSNAKNKFEIINAFFSRVFFLEMYGYIGDDDDEQ